MTIAYIAFGFLFFILGLALPKIPFNDYGIGIKFPWILHDREAWEMTHRISSLFWTLDVILFIMWAFNPQAQRFTIIYVVLIIVCISICPLIISIWAHNISKKRGV